MRSYAAEFGAEVKRIRLKRGLSIKELADLSGVKQITLARLERGNDVRADVLIKLCRALNLKHHFAEEPVRLEELA